MKVNDKLYDAENKHLLEVWDSISVTRQSSPLVWENFFYILGHDASEFMACRLLVGNFVVTYIYDIFNI